MNAHVSPKQLSRSVGVSESSLKRWVDEGVLKAVKTAGGHRRIALHEAVRFIRQSGMQLVDPAAIGLPEVQGHIAAVGETAAADEALRNALLAGDGPTTRGLILGGYLAGQDMGVLMDRLITPALHQIGDLWRHDAEGIFIEHRATALCIESISQLRTLFPATKADAPVAVGGAISGDVYMIPTLMAATVLAADGWRVTNLGADTPVESLLLAARSTAASLVWVSISVEPPNGKLSQKLQHLRNGVASLDASLVVGGRALPSAGLLRSSQVHVAESMSELASFAAGLAACRT